MSKTFRGLMKGLMELRSTLYSQRTGKRDWGYWFFNVQMFLKEKLWYSWVDPITNFKDNVLHVLKWVPILWRDRDWNDIDILKILKHKIQFQREHIKEYGHHDDASEDIRNMRIAEFLLDRLTQPWNYTMADEDEHSKQWPYERCTINDDGSITLPDLTERERKELDRIRDKKEYMWNQDMIYLGKHLRKHVRSWWD